MDGVYQITQKDVKDWHDRAIGSVVDALVGDVPSKLRMVNNAPKLAIAVLHLLTTLREAGLLSKEEN